ncbi:MAG: nitrite reductase small subunit NirD [Pseudomonadota bacterium]
MSDFIDIGHLDDIPTEGARVVKTPLGCVAVFRTTEDEVFALDDRCPHKGGPLSNGIQHGRSVTCPLHNWVISLETGEVAGEEATPVTTWAVEVRGGRILLDRSRLASPVAAE